MLPFNIAKTHMKTQLTKFLNVHRKKLPSIWSPHLSKHKVLEPNMVPGHSGQVPWSPHFHLPPKKGRGEEEEDL